MVLGAEGYEGSTAVVCEMSAMDCKVAILDPSRSFKKAEHHVKSSDMRLIHEEWRIGTRHIIGGLQSSRMKHLNGLAACVRPWACAFRNVFKAFVQTLFSSKLGMSPTNSCLADISF